MEVARAFRVLLAGLQAERRATAHLVALLIELGGRRLYPGQGFSSLFTYCTQALHLSEHAAYNRIETARAARRFPIILDWLAAGDLTLTSVRLLAPHLTPDNHHEVLTRARHKGKREVEWRVATLHPRADVPSAIRKLPACRKATPPAPRTEERVLAADGKAALPVDPQVGCARDDGRTRHRWRRSATRFSSR